MLELALLDKVHEPLEGDDAEDKCDDHADQKFRGEVTSFGALGCFFWIFQSHLGDFFDVLALKPLDAIEEGCTANGRDTHEEAEFAGVLAVHAHEHHGADGRTATADARDAGDALHGSGHKGAPPVHLDAFVIRVLGAGRAPLRCEKQKTGEKFCNADGARVLEKAFECVLEAEADHCRRDACENNVARFAELVAIATEATDDDVRNLLVKHHEDRKQRACVEHDVEEHARFVHV